MKLSSIVNLAFKEVAYSKKMFVIFILNVSIGIMGLSTIEYFKKSFQNSITTKSKDVLGADLSISSRVKITNESLSKVESIVGKNVEKSFKVRTFSMINFKELPKLSSLIAYESNYPFYGEIKTSKRSKKVLASLSYDEVLVAKDVHDQLGVKIDDTLTIGNKIFNVVGIVEDDPTSTITFGSIAPKIYMSQKGLDATGLMQFGTTASYTYYFKILGAYDDTLVDQVNKALNNSSIRVNTPSTRSQQIGRSLNYLNDF